MKISFTFILWLVSVQANAILIDRGNGFVYDDVLDITWTENANLAATESFGVSLGAQGSGVGSMFWSTANEWITGMNTAGYLGIDSWRLPTSNVDGIDNIVNCQNVATTELECRDNEYGYMYFYNGVANLTYSPFSNVQANKYWSSSENGIGGAYNLNFGNGVQNDSYKNIFNFVWAVTDGDVGAVFKVPESSALVLLICGLASLGFKFRIFRNNSLLSGRNK